jgi:hypothetical protein
LRCAEPPAAPLTGHDVAAGKVARPSYFSRGRKGAHEFFHDFVTGKGTLEPADWAWDELGVLLRIAKLPPLNILLSTHWTMGAVRHGDYVAKVSFAPTQQSTEMLTNRVLDPPSTPDIDSRRSIVTSARESHAHPQRSLPTVVDPSSQAEQSDPS